MLAFLAIAAALQSAPAPGAGATPQKLALARQVLEASGGQDRVAQTMHLVLSTTFASVQKSLPPEQARFVDRLGEDLATETATLAPQLIAISEQTYAQVLTEQELRDELAWVTSPSGHAIQQKTPAITQTVLAAEVPLIQTLMPKIRQDVLLHVCQEMSCSPHDREVLAAALLKSIPGKSG